MIEFKIPEISDRPWAEPIIDSSGQLGCDCGFATMFIWRHEYNIKIAKYKGFLLKAVEKDGKIAGYSFPIGNGHLKEALAVLFADAKERGIKLKFMPLTEVMAEELMTFAPDRFSLTEIRDSADYIYLTDDLAALPGKRYHSKRNHISKFLRQYNWNFETLTDSNLSGAVEVAKAWCKEHGCGDSDDTLGETCAMREAFSNFSALGLFGGILRVSGVPVAMTVASRISNECIDVHFEKAVSGYDGAYTAVNNIFASSIDGYKYINREEDMGIEGLRKAKLSYHPHILLRKFKAIEND